jgi:protein disulfide-isomerase
MASNQRLGANGAPFFLFNEKYTVSGAQAPLVFAEILTKAYKAWSADHPISLEVNNGTICTSEGKCDSTSFK